MREWKALFEKHNLEQGKALVLNDQVNYYQKTEYTCTASIAGKISYPVLAYFSGNEVQRMRCGCPVAKGGRNCAHMAALLYYHELSEQAEKEQRPIEAVLKEWKNREKEPDVQKSPSSSRTSSGSRKKNWKQMLEDALEAAAEKDRKIAERAAKRKKEKEEQERRQQEAAADELLRQAEEQKRQEKEQKQQAEERKRQEEERKRQEEERNRQAQERDRKRREREERKKKKAQKEEENKRRLAEALEKENQKRLAEEERRAKIREQKALEARRKEEKRRQEQEAARILAERRKKEEQEKKEEAERKAREQRTREEQLEKERLLAERQAKELAERLAAEKKTDRANRYALLGESLQPEEDDWNGSGSIEELHGYRYFDALKIERSMKITAKSRAEGESLFKRGRLRIDQITSGYNSDDGQIMGAAFATGDPEADPFPVRLYFTQYRVVDSQCGCPQCSSYYYYYWRNTEPACAYKAGVLLYLKDYLQKHNLGDTTDMYADRFLHSFQKSGARRVSSVSASELKELRLEPRMIKKEGKLMLSFKYGAEKLFVIKRLDEFCEHVKNRENAVYGSKTELPHDPQALTEEGKQWFRLIQQVIQEEDAFGERLREHGYDVQRIVSSGNALDLNGWRLDTVYHQMRQTDMPFEDWDTAQKSKSVLKRGEKNPILQVEIRPDQDKNGKHFQGILVSIRIPEIYPGTDAAYYIEDGKLLKISKDYYQKLELIHEQAEDGSMEMRIGRNKLMGFYYHVLPQLQEIAQVIETEADKIRSYLIAKGQYRFYLDADKENIICQATVVYDGREFDLLDQLRDEEETGEEFRDWYGESEAVSTLLRFLKYYDPDTGTLHNKGEEEAAYQLFVHGLDELRELGEVYCTPQFLSRRKVRKVKASVGVSVSEGMLDLKISTEELGEEELLDILSGYRQKKKYYRLKDGSFVDLEDQNLRTMAELVEILRLKTSDLKKDHLLLPMYRGLYLDKLLESNEELYEDRDATLRRMTSQFRSIENADFEVPKSLRKIMRSYQKDGFKWLKTLEGWGFGGILADEMGLGKTLQAISLLLNLKEEGKAGVSLIVCPASLVYNWEEELHRFAPSLLVRTITGNQEERADLLEKTEADVLVTSYDLLKRDIVHYEKKSFLVEIIDEAQYIKNHATAAAKSVKVIQSRLRFALTGTPVENRLSELWSIFDYLMPGFLYGYEVFRREYENPIVKNEDEEKMQRLQQLTGPFILRRRKEDVLKDLPEKLEEVRYVRLEKKQQQIYDGQVVKLKRQIGAQSDQEFNQNRLQVLAELTRLRQICCDPSLCFEKYDGETAKTQACMDLIRGAIDGGHRMLVFSQFTSMLEILEKYLKKEEIEYYLLTGSTTKEQRRELVKQFNEGTVPVFLISLKAGGVGLNLTGADIVIHYDPWWNLAAQNQATDRAHRIGQTRKVTVYKLIAKDTIEEKILKLQEKKKQLAEQILSGDGAQLASLSKEELLEILGEELT